MKTEMAITKSTVGFRVWLGDYRFVLIRSKGTKFFNWEGFHYPSDVRCTACGHELEPPEVFAGRCGVYAVLNLIPGTFGIYAQVDKSLH